MTGLELWKDSTTPSEVPPRAVLQALSVENPLGTPTFSQFPDISCSSKNFQTIRVYGEKFVDKL